MLERIARRYGAASTVLAVDVGGSKVAAGLVSVDGRLLVQRRVETPRTADGEQVFATVAALCEEVLGLGEPVACGIGTAGVLSRGGSCVSPMNIPGWKHFPLRERVRQATGLPTFMDNDAKALARGEGWVGATRGVDNFVALVLGTGVGAGIVLEGQVLDGADGNAGHVGHLVVDPDGSPCDCGSRGCLEAEVSGLAIDRLTGHSAVGASLEVVERTGRFVGQAVASLANLLDLQLAVVGGSVALGFGGPFFAAAQEEIDRRARLDFSRGTRILPAGLGADGPLVGAAAVAWDGYARVQAARSVLATPADRA